LSGRPEAARTSRLAAMSVMMANPTGNAAYGMAIGISSAMLR
jgi:hypothetical protein